MSLLWRLIAGWLGWLRQQPWWLLPLAATLVTASEIAGVPWWKATPMIVITVQLMLAVHDYQQRDHD